MAIKEEYIEVTLNPTTISYYENLGYHIPRRLDKRGRTSVAKGTKIKAKISDLSLTSGINKITRICDICGHETKNIGYGSLIRNRINGDGKDRCIICSNKKSGITRKRNVPLERSFGYINPSLVNEWNITKNKISAYEVYCSSHTKYEWICTDCKSIYEKTPKERHKGRGCPYCSSTKINHTNSLESRAPELLVEWDYHKNEIQPSEVLATSTAKVAWKCSKGHSWCSNVYTRVKYNTGCPICFGNQKKTTEQFKHEMYRLVKNEYELMSEYINSRANVSIKHRKCGKSYTTTPSAFLRGKRCHYCKGGISYSHEEFINVLNLRRPNFFDDYKILSKYINTVSEMKIKHIKCGCEFETAAYNLLKKASCPICHGYCKKDTKVFAQQVNLLTEGEYQLASEYIADSDKVKLKHLECGHVYKTIPSNFIQGGSRCPRCRPPKKSESKGEERIRLYLTNNNYVYVSQFEFEDCRDRTPLKFDFAVLERKDQPPLLLIEFDGLQHYEPVKYWGGQKTFNNIRRRDKIKDNYCKSHNIPLIRIKYTEFDNIESILNEKLAQLNILPVSPALS
ncbi:DUF2726 domain-containing protein [Paenibacillus sp. EKM208P]|nr:DUF2726 domain-containing protein [Paenibacillus sp. EKM208P]